MIRPLWLRQTLPSKRTAVLGGFCWLRRQDLFKTLQLKSGFETLHGQNLPKNLKTTFGFKLSVVKPLKTPNTAGIFQFKVRHSNLYGGSDETHSSIEHSAQTHCSSCFPISSFV